MGETPFQISRVCHQAKGRNPTACLITPLLCLQQGRAHRHSILGQRGQVQEARLDQHDLLGSQIPDGGEAVCGYCNIKFRLKEDEEDK